MTLSDPIVLDVVVRCTEIDVNGHVNNARYVEYLEWSREEWYERHGFTHARLQEQGGVTVVVNVNLNLRQPCHQGDRLRLFCWPVRRGRTSFVLGQRIEKPGGEIAADALVTLVMVDPATNRSRVLPEEFARWFPATDPPLGTEENR